MRADAAEITSLLHRWSEGDSEALSSLLPVTYDYLRRVAQRLMSAERSDHTLQATELVHEAYMRLVGGRRPEWNDRHHFFAVCALVMRRLLVDHARRKTLHGRLVADQATLEATGFLAPGGSDLERLLELDSALDRLAEMDERKAHIVQLRVFGGLTLDQVAEVLGVSQATVVRDWRFSRAWLESALRPR